MKAISYDGTTFASLNVAAGIPGDLPGPDVSPVLIERFGATPIHAGLGRGARTIPVVFTVKPGNSVETTLMTLLAALDPDDESERVLAAQLNAGTDVYVNAAVAGYSYLAVNQVQVLFTASDPAWKKTSRRYSPGTTVADYSDFTADGSLTVQNDGQTTALPVVRLRWGHAIDNNTFATNTTGWSVSADAGITAALTRDTSVTYSTGGSGKLAITANTAGAGAKVAVINYSGIACAAGKPVVASVAVRTSNANITPRISIDWYGVSGYISGTVEADWTPVANQWSLRSHTAYAPAGTTNFTCTVLAYCDTAGPTGNIWIDDINLARQRADGDCMANFGYRYRRTITVTNTSTRTLRRYPVYLDLDDTKAWVTASKALSSGNDIRVFHNGRELPRTLIGHNQTLVSGTTGTSSSRTVITLSGTPLGAGNYYRAQFLVRGTGATKWETAEIVSNTSSSVTLLHKLSAIPASGVAFKIRNTWCWTVIDELQAGAETTLEVVYGNPNAGAPPELTGTEAPAFDLLKSSNGTWRYKLKGSGPSASATSGRGLWYVSPNGREVNALSWDVPGAWSRLNYLDNRDDRTQLRASRVDTAGYYETASSSTVSVLKVRVASDDSAPGWELDQWIGARVVISGQTRYVTDSDADSLTLHKDLTGSAPAAGVTLTLSTNMGRFDAQRTWQDNAQYPEEGAYDGVMLSHPLGIKRLEGYYSLTNPASIAKLVLVSRSSGGEDWAKDFEATATTILTQIEWDYDAGAYPIQLGVALSANDDVVIPTSYAKDTGTASSGTSTTLTDQNKAWVTNQWTDATVRVVGGRGSPSGRKSVASNTATALTLKSGQTFATTPDDTSRYIVTADHKASAALITDWLTVTVDASQLTIGDISDEEAIYDVGKGNASDGWLTLYMGGGTNHTTYPHTLVRIGGAGKRLFLPASAILRIDTANRTVRLYDSSEASFTSVPWAVDFYRRNRKGTLARTSDWLPVKAADSKIWIANPVWGSSALSLEADLEEAFLG